MDSPTEVAPGLTLLAGRPRNAINVYVMGDALVDAGTRHARNRILRQVQGRELRSHVLTHGHLDHMGASHEVCTELRLPLLCGEGDVAMVESGGRDGLSEAPLVVRLEHRFMAGAGHPVQRSLSEGDEIAGFTVFEVPGHSPGHLAFWRESDRVLVAGDVFFNINPLTGRPGLRLPPDVFTPDPAQNLESARRLAALEPEIVCFGHGPPLREPERLQRFIATASVKPQESEAVST
jgi:hydroxyacylglutathione hydrolase